MAIKDFITDTQWILEEYSLFQIVTKDNTTVIGCISDYKPSYILITPYSKKEFVEKYGECELAGNLLIHTEEVKYIFLLEKTNNKQNNNG